MHQLRPYQYEALHGNTNFPGIFDSFKQYQRALCVMPTGCGKTHVFAHACQEWVKVGGRALILAHREELLTQARNKLMSATGLGSVLEKAEETAYGALESVTVGSVQTLMKLERLERFPRDYYSHIVVDECHHCCPAGTLVDGIPIEKFKVDCPISSYDHLMQRVVTSRVTATMSRKVDAICEVRLSTGNSLVCTPDHPIFDGTIYIDAATLSCNDMVYEQVHKASILFGVRDGVSSPILEFSNDPVLLDCMQGPRQGGTKKACVCCVRGMRKAIRAIWAQIVPGQKWKNVLHQGLQPCIRCSGKFRNDGANKQKVRIESDEETKSNGNTFFQKQDDSHIEGASISTSRRKRQDSETPTTDVRCPDCMWVSSPAGAWYFDQDSQRFVHCNKSSYLLQTRHIAPCIQDRRRDRRVLPFDQTGEGKRYQENSDLVGVRVESITVHKCGCGSGFDRLCPDGRVYNLEVAGNNNYFANNILVHNCLSDSYQRIFSYFEGAKVLGVTATPDRGDLKDLGRFFQVKAFEYLLPQAIAEGYLCKMRAQMIPLTLDLSGVKCNGDWDDIEVGRALMPYVPQIANELWQRCQNRKMLVFAPLCAISQYIREALARVGFRAYYASGEYRDEMDKWNTEGKGACMVNAMLLNEGYDCPDIDTVCVLRPTKIRSLYTQMVGRGTRPHPKKDYLLIPDFLWHSEKHSICHPAHLLAENEDVAEIMVKNCEATAGGEPEEVDMDAVKAAQEEVLRQREEALAKKLAEQRRKKAKLVDPLQFAVSIGDETLTDYQPVMQDESKPATLEQMQFLENNGIATTEMTNGLAQRAIRALQKRKAEGLALPKQIRFLERFGFKHVGRMKRGEAGILIGRIAANSYRLPDNLEYLTR